MSLKKQFALLLAVKNAGFKLVNTTSTNASDGPSWEATLAFGSSKLVRVSNGGYGGPDETDFLETQKLQMATIKAHLNTFLAIPVVQDCVKESLIQTETYSLEFGQMTQTEFDAKKAEIMASSVALTTDAIEITVQALADGYDSLKVIKREVKRGLCAAIGDDDAEGTWKTWKGQDTPANRAAVSAMYKVDYFLADVIAGL